VLVNSAFMVGTVGRVYGVSPVVSPLGVDTDAFRPSGVARGRFVLSVGSLTPLKGFDFVVEAVGRLPAGVRPPVVVASNFQNPPEREFLERLARDRGVALELRGNVGEDALVGLYNTAAAVAYSPVREPFGLVALEAMACGAPIVSVAEGGVIESVVDGVTGRLTPREPAAFAGALGALLADPAEARRLGENGRRHVVARWTWDDAAAAMEAQLRSCAAGGRVPALGGTPFASVRGAATASR
jgi:glycosyltransferase involved in cell wall biosynthesis